MKMTKVCFVGSNFWPLSFHMRPHIKKISEKSFITLVAKDIKTLNRNDFPTSTVFKDIQIQRKISLFCDVKAFIHLWFFFRSEKFQTIHSITPKAGLIAMLAAKLAFVPIRIHTFTGQIWVNKKGFERLFFILIDRLIAGLSTQVIADSFSQKAFLVASNVASSEKIIVLGNGSVVGIDTSRFKPDMSARLEIRNKFGIKSEDVVFIFVGRLTRDKGVGDLISAFDKVCHDNLSSHLIIVGPDEENFDKLVIEKLPQTLRQRIHRVLQTSSPEQYMAASDVLCLPSYREGFGSVVIEAASVGLPSIASRIYGLSDAIVDQETGLLHEVGDVQEIANKMIIFCENFSLRLAMGAAAQVRAINLFSEIILTSAFEQLYIKLGVFNNSSLDGA